MPYIKVSTSSSGARTVQLATKDHWGRSVILKHFGSAHTPIQLEQLKLQAKQEMNRPAPGQLKLFTSEFKLDRVRVTSHKPEYFERLIAHYYNLLDFTDLGPELLFDLVMTRIYQPCSKLRSLRILEALFGRSYNRDKAYRLLRSLAKTEETEEVKGVAERADNVGPSEQDTPQLPLSLDVPIATEEIKLTDSSVVVNNLNNSNKEEKIGTNTKDKYKAKPSLPHLSKIRLEEKLHAAHTKHYGGALTVVLYDVTTLYSESARDGDEYKVPGYSKDGKHKDPQILVGLLTNMSGFPLGYETFAGKTFEGGTLLIALLNPARSPQAGH